MSTPLYVDSVAASRAAHDATHNGEADAQILRNAQAMREVLGNVATVTAGSQTELTEAAEELSFSHSEQVETRTAKQRGVRAYEVPKLPLAQEVIELLQRLGNRDAAADLERLAKRLHDAAAKREDLWAVLGGWDSDPSKQYLGLAYALQQAGEDPGQSGVRERLSDAMERLLGRQGGAIYAGLNTVSEAELFARGAADPAQATAAFRTTYRDAVLGEERFVDTLNAVLERFGEEGFESGVGLLRKALGSDLAAIRPSTDRVRLHAVLQELYQLATAAATLQRCRVMIDNLHRGFGMQDMKPIPLMQGIVRLTGEPSIFGFQIEDLMRQYYPPSPAAEIAFLSGVQNVFRTLPPKVFATDEHRLYGVAAVQQVLDARIQGESA